jgi:hypothetical protein
VWQEAQPVAANSDAPVEARQAAVGAGGSMVLRKATSEVRASPSASGDFRPAAQP